MSVGGFAPPPHTHLKESAFGLHALYTKAHREAILLLSAKDMTCQTGADILTSCPTYDESACSIYDEKNEVSENKNRPEGDGRAVGQTVGRSDSHAKVCTFLCPGL